MKISSFPDINITSTFMLSMIYPRSRNKSSRGPLLARAPQNQSYYRVVLAQRAPLSGRVGTHSRRAPKKDSLYDDYDKKSSYCPGLSSGNRIKYSERARCRIASRVTARGPTFFCREPRLKTAELAAAIRADISSSSSRSSTPDYRKCPSEEASFGLCVKFFFFFQFRFKLNFE